VPNQKFWINNKHRTIIVSRHIMNVDVYNNYEASTLDSI